MAVFYNGWNPMSVTSKQEAFCRAYLETGDADAAYRRVYAAGAMTAVTIGRKARELLANGKIAARIGLLRDPVVQDVQGAQDVQDAQSVHAMQPGPITLETHLADLKALRDKAEQEGKYGYAIQAEIARGRAFGLYTDKAESMGKGGKDVLPQSGVLVVPGAMTVEQWEARGKNGS
jgi:phage terminase small subunit